MMVEQLHVAFKCSLDMLEEQKADRLIERVDGARRRLMIEFSRKIEPGLDYAVRLVERPPTEDDIKQARLMYEFEIPAYEPPEYRITLYYEVK